MSRCSLRTNAVLPSAAGPPSGHLAIWWVLTLRPAASRDAVAGQASVTGGLRARLGATLGADSRIARGDLAAEIGDLKRAPGRDLVAHGGAAFAQSLERLRLVDEYRLVLQPVALGHRLPLVRDLPAPHLHLAEARTFRDRRRAIHVDRTES